MSAAADIPPVATTPATATAATAHAPRMAPPWRAPLLVLAIGLVAWWALPEQLGLLTRIAITALFVLSLDLVVGIAGLATLGHAAMFGAGAYAAGIFALRLHPDPLLGLAAATGAGALLALASGAFVLRYQGFTFLMLTVAVGQITLSLAQKARDWTGGDDGLTGFSMGPLLGRFAFDLEGRTAALYALVVLCLGPLRRAARGRFAVRTGGARHPREPCTHGRARHAGAAPAARDVHAGRRAGRRGRCAVGADQCDRRPRQPVVRALGRSTGDADPGRRGAACTAH